MREAVQEAVMALLALIILGLSIYGAVCLYQTMIRNLEYKFASSARLNDAAMGE